MHTLFVDMDGTLARFYENADCLEACNEPGFFAQLRPYEAVVEAVNKLASREHKDHLHVFVLSAIPARNTAAASKEKREWLNRHMENGKRIKATFPVVPADKVAVAERILRRRLCPTDFLLDDYTANLRAWEAGNGTAIKCINEIQNARTEQSFQGHVIFGHEDPGYMLYKQLCRYLQIEEI